MLFPQGSDHLLQLGIGQLTFIRTHLVYGQLLQEKLFLERLELPVGEHLGAPRTCLNHGYPSFEIARWTESQPGGLVQAFPSMYRSALAMQQGAYGGGRRPLAALRQ